MQSGSQSRRVLPIAIGLLVSSVLLIKFDQRGDAPGFVGRGVVSAVSPLQSAMTSLGSSVNTLWLEYVDLVDAKEKGLALGKTVRELRHQLAELEELRAENGRLRQLLELGDRRKDLRLRAARVVGRSTSPYFRVLRIVLDVGDGHIKPGMPVLAAGGVVGQIRFVSGTRAEVLLVTDPRSAIDVVLESSRARGVAVGTGEEDRYAARLKYLQHNLKAEVGERVLTTGEDERYPRGLVVGRVESVEDDATGPFQKARVRPLVEFGALDEVFIVLGPSGLTADGKRLQGQDQ